MIKGCNIHVTDPEARNNTVDAEDFSKLNGLFEELRQQFEDQNRKFEELQRKVEEQNTHIERIENGQGSICAAV